MSTHKIYVKKYQYFLVEIAPYLELRFKIFNIKIILIHTVIS